MQYWGGKSRIAKYIAPIVNAERTVERPYFWDPFCGGLSVAVQLAVAGPGVVSDVNPALIALYQAVSDGWEPPEQLSEAEWNAARDLPDSNPLKAFAGFGCSVLGKWFGGYEQPRVRNYTKRGEVTRAMRVDRIRASRKSLLRDVPKLMNCHIVTTNFLEIEPRPWPGVIYSDPPYAGTTGYTAVAPFDHALFWRLCAEWEKVGVPVFVSEYTCPVAHVEIWSRAHSLSVSAGRRDCTERLFRVLP